MRKAKSGKKLPDVYQRIAVNSCNPKLSGLKTALDEDFKEKECSNEKEVAASSTALPICQTPIKRNTKKNRRVLSEEEEDRVEKLKQVYGCSTDSVKKSMKSPCSSFDASPLGISEESSEALFCESPLKPLVKEYACKKENVDCVEIVQSSQEEDARKKLNAKVLFFTTCCCLSSNTKTPI